MREQDESTPPQDPNTTPQEAEAQAVLGLVRDLLRTARAFLDRLHAALVDPEDGDDMGEGRRPESLTFALRGSIECAISDHLDPGIRTLEEAVALTPAALVADWQRRQEARR
jgi:hypothetical protein